MAETIVTIIEFLSSLLDFFKNKGSPNDLINAVQDFMNKAAALIENLWDTGRPDDDDKDDDDDTKPLCYIATKTYARRDLTKFYVVKNSLPKSVVKGYYAVGKPLSIYIPRIVFLPFLEAIKGVMQ